MENNHLLDTELMMALDGELAAAAQRAVDQHLLACWQCRARRARLERSVEDFVEWHAQLPVPSGDGPRALLRARLAQLVSMPPAPQPPRRLGWAALAAAAGGLAVLVFWQASTNVAIAIPDPSHTPGVTLPVSAAEVCQPEFANRGRAISPEMAGQVFLQYGIRNPGPGHYEVDYLITPALGGADDIRNMWPQPYSTGLWNSHVKDALEDRLRQLVCSHKLTLAQAQRELSGNWVAAYQRHFQTARPLGEHARFVKDKPWG
jgi:hypothetical protein